MFAGEIGALILRCLSQHPSPTASTAVFGYARFAKLNHAILGVFQEFTCEGRGLLPVCKDGHRLPCASQSDIEEAAFLRMVEFFGHGEDEIEQRIINDLGRKSVAVRGGPQDDNVVGFQAF